MNSIHALSNKCIHCHQRCENFLCGLSRKSLMAFEQIKHRVLLPECSIVCVEGQAPRGIFILRRGQVKLSIGSRDGRAFMLRIAKPGEVLGLHSVVSGKPYDVTVETMQPSQLDFVEQMDFLDFIKGHDDAGLRAAQRIVRDSQDAYDAVHAIEPSQSVSGRVAKFLLGAAEDGTITDGAVCVKLGLTQENIAQLIGTNRETVTRTLSDFKRKDIVELKHSTLIIHDKPALERLATA